MIKKRFTQKLTIAINKLLDFAQVKADSFYTNSQVNSTKISEKKIKKQLHLIDQNIMIATLDTKENILEITNKFFRYINQDKVNLLRKKSNFFMGDDSSKSDVILRTLMSGKTWEGEIKRVIKGDETKHFHAQIIPNYNDKFEISSFTNIIHDISDKKALEILSITDKLTNLFNRRHFDMTLPKELSIAKRTNSQLTLVIIDIDYFKKYNEQVWSSSRR